MIGVCGCYCHLEGEEMGLREVSWEVGTVSRLRDSNLTPQSSHLSRHPDHGQAHGPSLETVHLSEERNMWTVCL